MREILHQAGGLVMNGQNVLMVTSRQSRRCWLFPKGDIDPGQTAETAARREIMEEAGVGESMHGREKRLRRWVTLAQAARRFAGDSP